MWFFSAKCSSNALLIGKTAVITGGNTGIGKETAKEFYKRDTSASMYQRAYLGGRPTLLDVAKSAVETFVKVRQRSQESRGDRYMLLTFEDPPNNIKAGWKENLATFMHELKNLQCFTMTSMGVALKHAFDMLNLNRMQTGIDTYGQGRCPFYLEPSLIIVITDGGKLTSSNGVLNEFNLPMNSQIPGAELTREPFRWDQRLFALVLRLAGTPAIERDTGLVPNDTSPIEMMCEVTGGRSYSITSHRMLMQCIDSLVQKVQSGVVINFEKIGPDPPDRVENETVLEESETKSQVSVNPTLPNNGPPPAWHNCRKLIYVPRTAQKGITVGFWPIPESYWPELDMQNLPPRSAHPNVKFTCTSQEPMVIENLPFDKYELEPSPLTQFILARKQPTTCWQVFIANSYKSSDVVHPFGYLKASTNLNCVNLFVMPYNYPVLLPLLEELIQVHYMKPTNEWRTQFQNYMRTMPAYYAGPLRRALQRMGIPVPLAQSLITESAENSLSYPVFNYLKRVKSQAKTDFDKLCNDVLSKQNTLSIKQSSTSSSESVAIKVTSVVKKDILLHPNLKEKFATQREQFIDYINFVIGVDTGHVPSYQTYRNPFDIPRDRLLDHVVRMRSNYLQPTTGQMKYTDEDLKHSIPINQMGNYQEYLKRQPPKLRELETPPTRQHMFGNPFKIDKRMMVDEADIDLVGGSSNNVGSPKGSKRSTQADYNSARLPNKRKPGPLSKYLRVHRPSAGSLSPIHSPVLPSPVPEDWPVTSPEGPLNYSESSSDMSLFNGEESSSDMQPMETIPTFLTLESPIYVPSNLDLLPANPLSSFESTVSREIEKSPVDTFAELILSLKTKVMYHRHNQTVKSNIFREIRIPGKGFKNIPNHINSIKGGIDVQISVVKQVIIESQRFKLSAIVKQLEKLLEELLSEKNGARVIIACRSLERGEKAAEDILKECESRDNCGTIIVKHLDLNNLSLVKQCAKSLLESEQCIDLLINNAGILCAPNRYTDDGFESHFGVNHLGHFLFTLLLLPRIIESAPARVVNVSSVAYERGSIDFDDLNFQKRPYNHIAAYAQSKLANILFSRELAYRLEGTQVTTYSLHPGIIRTELGRNMDLISPVIKFLWRIFAKWTTKTPEQGAQTTIHCSIDEKAGQETGLYYSECQVTELAKHARDDTLAKELWNVSVKLVGLESYDPFKK